MLNPFIDLFAQIINLYSYCVIARVIVEMLVSFKVVNAFQPAVQKIRYALNRLCEPVLRRIRKYLPDLGGIDISPIILLLLLNFAQSALYKYFYNL
ncbi:MAG: YggT family protein [Alphaproteobacteria bacterium]|nr:YggT family protein [Alphaproteobacteria bacterium]